MTSPDSTSKSNDDSPIPDAYREGSVEFLGCKIYLDSRPLIPRTETEWWVEKCIEKLKAQSSPLKALKVLDLFAGSGCCGVAVLKHVPSAQVDFGELEPRHLPTIQKNIVENGIDPSRTQRIQTDVYIDVGHRYDYILANPPYLAESRLGRIEQSVLAHEPHEALLAPDDGFELIRRTIEGAPDRLTTGGELWVEHEPEHSARVQQLATTVGGTAVTYPDQYGVERYSVILFS